MTTFFKHKDQDFTQLYETYSGKVLRLCMGYTGSEELAQDLLQETFIAVWQGMDRFRGSSQPGTWIYRIAVNTCLSHLRSPKNKPKAELKEHMENRPEELPDTEQRIQLLYRCINELAATDRLIITMVLEDIPYPEIAESTGIKEGNLRVKIHRIKQQLNEIYKKYEQL
ncbi:MAG: sigma-70 family RNA polymerase sigma factor [Chitinophagaceae bacterium]